LRLFCLALAAGLAGATVAAAQTTNFGTVEKSFKLPKGSKINPNLGLRRIKPKKKGDAEQEEPVLSAAEQRQDELEKELESLLVGAWSLVTTADRPLDEAVVEAAARRCFRQMPLKPVAFENAALEQIPDIGYLFGDLVYYKTSKGLQRLDIEKGLVLLLSKVNKTQIGPSKIIWEVANEKLRLRIRFSRSPSFSTKIRFMLEEAGVYLRCPLPDQENTEPDE